MIRLWAANVASPDRRQAAFLLVASRTDSGAAKDQALKVAGIRRAECYLTLLHETNRLKLDVGSADIIARAALHRLGAPWPYVAAFDPKELTA